jgi:hypothetical protein
MIKNLKEKSHFLRIDDHDGHQDSLSRAILQSNSAVLLVEGGDYSAAVSFLTKPLETCRIVLMMRMIHMLDRPFTIP